MDDDDSEHPARAGQAQAAIVEQPRPFPLGYPSETAAWWLDCHR
jgi:hypothetical protein